MSKLILVLDMVDGFDEEDILTEINAEILCRLEEDYKVINGWSWHRKEDIYQTREMALIEL